MNATKSAKAVVKNAAPPTDPITGSRTRRVHAANEMSRTPGKALRAIIRSLIALILIWAGLSKLGDPVSAYTSLLEYQLPAPGVLLKLVAVILPWLELLCGLMSLANFHRRLATLVTLVLFGVFLVMVGQAVVRGLNISCGCFNLAIFGIDQASPFARFIESPGVALVRNLILLGGAVYLLRADKTQSS